MEAIHLLLIFRGLYFDRSLNGSTVLAVCVGAYLDYAR